MFWELGVWICREAKTWAVTRLVEKPRNWAILRKIQLISLSAFWLQRSFYIQCHKCQRGMWPLPTTSFGRGTNRQWRRERSNPLVLLLVSRSHRRPFPPSSTCSACSCSHRQFCCSSGCQLGWWEARPGGNRGSWQPLGSEGPTGQLPTPSTRQPCCFLSPAVLTTMWETGCLGKHVSMLTVPESGTAEVTVPYG